jgi:hypothetical protein
MRNTCMLLVVLMCLSAVPIHAEEMSDSGNALLRMCSAVDDKPIGKLTTEDYGKMLGCYGYLRGLHDGFMFGKILWTGNPPFCNSPDVDMGQEMKIVLKYVRDNPAKAHHATPLLYLDAMTEAFPCSDKK